MDSEKLLEDLTIYQRLPEAALGEATERRVETLPTFLAAIQEFLDDDDPVPELPTSLFMIFHLLGSWREKSAYRLVARFLMSDPERLEWQLGDALTETAPRVMLNLFDGDQQPIRDIIECESANEYIRAEMFAVLATLAHRGDVPREGVARHLREAYSSLQPQSEHYVWVGWESAVASLGLNELSGLVDEAFDRGFIDPGIVTKDNFRREMKAALSDPNHRLVDRLRVTPFGDTIDELSKWHGFTEEGIAGRKDDREAAGDIECLDPPFDYESAPAFPLVETVVNPYRHTGRNDPCPCGSGKKFKRCCLGKPA